MSNPNPAASFDFGQLVASRAIPGAESTTSNHAGGFPNSGGNAGGILEGSVDDAMPQHGGLDNATTLGSVNSIFSAISQEGVFTGDMFAVFEKYLGNLQRHKNFKSLLALGGVSLTNARLFLGSEIIPSPQGQGKTQGG